MLKELRVIEKNLAELTYSHQKLSIEIINNLDFARANLISSIYDQAILEGVTTTFSTIETIIDNGKVSNMKADDVLKILNLKHAWEFLLDEDVILSPAYFYLLSSIAKLINESFYYNGGKIRTLPVKTGGTSYIPPIPNEINIKETLSQIIFINDEAINKAIELCLYVMKTQIFNDGNKRTAVIFANHYLINNGKGLLVVSEDKVPAFKKLLVDYYDEKDELDIKRFMKEER